MAAAMVGLVLVVSAALIGLDYWRERNWAIANAQIAMGRFSQLLLDRFDALSAEAANPLTSWRRSRPS